ncbi:MAG: hypothetical protein Q4A17_09395 [Thermoguttaceae bacterium]|nr:hypothetical protein [Thermoguttaceae bacterium]MDO4858144.1 hypothetical protein [Thermoguttaceae bacterium]
MKKSTKLRRGSLSFEWIVITTLLVIGMISGLGALRNSVVKKLDDLTTSVETLNTAADPTNSSGG